MILASKCKRLRTKNEQRERFNNNRMFKEKQKAFYAKLRGQEALTVTDPPPKEDVTRFWKGILGNKKEHNPNASWLEVEREKMQNVDQDTWAKTSEEEVAVAVKNLKNWKTPGVDKVQNYWIKHLRSLFPLLTDAINLIVTDPEMAPTWLTEGKTTLMYKKGNENEAKNYRPITFLPTLYKFITLLITNRVYRHLINKKILAFEQKGCRRGTRGCKDQLLLDKHILEITKNAKRNASMMWIDYAKAYDSVPHSWIEESLHLYKVDTTTIRFILALMKKWRTRMVLPHANGFIETDESLLY